MVENIKAENKIYSDPDQYLDNTIKLFREVFQAFELCYTVQYLHPPRVSMDAVIER